MADPFTVPAGKLHAFIAKLSEAGITAEMVLAADTDPEIVKAMAEAAQRVVETADVNPFEMTVDEQIAALRRANAEERWGISDEAIAKLAETTPEWPKGRDSYRSFRIRFGEGDEGVARTFEAHVLRARHVFGDRKFRRWDLLRSDKRCLQLLAGDRTHKRAVEWITVRLDANRKRKSVQAVRGPTSLADEGLVLAWLFPERVEAIDHDAWVAWFCAGYELGAVMRATVRDVFEELWNDAKPPTPWWELLAGTTGESAAVIIGIMPLVVKAVRVPVFSPTWRRAGRSRSRGAKPKR